MKIFNKYCSVKLLIINALLFSALFCSAQRDTIQCCYMGDHSGADYIFMIGQDTMNTTSYKGEKARLHRSVRKSLSKATKTKCFTLLVSPSNSKDSLKFTLIRKKGLRDCKNNFKFSINEIEKYLIIDRNSKRKDRNKLEVGWLAYLPRGI